MEAITLISFSETDFARSLILWFRKHRIPHPWRTGRNPYAVWISEIMLQQTTVNAVIPFFNRWMKKFPTIKKLAKAKESTILKLWEGLGYYSRARNIRKTALIIAQTHGNEIPSDYNSLIALPGIGPYTAAAILSLAFKKPYPLMDANVKRICQRLLLLRKWDKSSDSITNHFLEVNISKNRPDDFNEGLMELGQHICRTGTPLCETCPVQFCCKANENGVQKDIPSPEKLHSIKKKNDIFIITCGDRILLKKNTSGMFTGLRTLPSFQRKSLEQRLGMRAKFLGQAVHHYTKYRDQLRIYRIDLKSPLLLNVETLWVSRKESIRHAMPKIHRMILEHYWKS